MNSEIQLVTKEGHKAALFTQWKMLKAALEETEEMIRDMGEIPPYTWDDRPLEKPKRQTLTNSVLKICHELKEGITTARVLTALLLDQPNGDFDANSISAILGKAADDDGPLVAAGKVAGSKAVIYALKGPYDDLAGLPTLE